MAGTAAAATTHARLNSKEGHTATHMQTHTLSL
jgi:hypothetical protein